MTEFMKAMQETMETQIGSLASRIEAIQEKKDAKLKEVWRKEMKAAREAKEAYP
jgi:flagellar capping protein FliD